jgi:hypothetical protein
MRSFGLPELLIIIFVGVILIKIVNARCGMMTRPRPNAGDFPPAGFCTKCGRPLTPGGSFCPFCGAHQV